MSKPRPYHKYNFILSVIGFIGSMGFYFGVLSKVYANDPDKTEIRLLKEQNELLKRELEQCQTP